MFLDRLGLSSAHQTNYSMGGSGERPFTHTKDTKCPALLSIAARKRNKCVTITSMSLLEVHNHPRSAELWKQYPLARILDTTEQAVVVQMQKDRVPNAAIVRNMRKNTGRSVLIKDVQNIRTRTDKDRRSGKSEIQLIDVELRAIRRKDAGVVNDTHDIDGKLHVVTFATTAMRAEYEKTPEVLFLDATYNVNKEKFCLYAILCEDANGVGQPVFVGLLSSEKEENFDFSSHD